MIWKHVGFEIELQIVWGEMKGVVRWAKSYCNKTMSSSRQKLFNQTTFKGNQRERENAEMKQSEGKGKKWLFGVTAWHGASASHILYLVQICFQRNATKVALGSYWSGNLRGVTDDQIPSANLFIKSFLKCTQVVFCSVKSSTDTVSLWSWESVKRKEGHILHRQTAVGDCYKTSIEAYKCALKESTVELKRPAQTSLNIHHKWVLRISSSQQ